MYRTFNSKIQVGSTPTVPILRVAAPRTICCIYILFPTATSPKASDFLSDFSAFSLKLALDASGLCTMSSVPAWSLGYHRHPPQQTLPSCASALPTWRVTSADFSARNAPPVCDQAANQLHVPTVSPSGKGKSAARKQARQAKFKTSGDFSPVLCNAMPRALNWCVT